MLKKSPRTGLQELLLSLLHGSLVLMLTILMNPIKAIMKTIRYEIVVKCSSNSFNSVYTAECYLNIKSLNKSRDTPSAVAPLLGVPY